MDTDHLDPLTTLSNPTVTGRSCYKPNPATGKPRHRGWSPALGSVYTHSSRATLSAPTLGHSVYAHNSGPVFTSTIPGPLHLHSQLRATSSTPKTPGPLCLHSQLRATPPALTAPGPFCSHSTSGQHSIYTQNYGPPRLRPQLRDLAASPTPCPERQLGARTGKPAQGCVAAPHSQSWGLRRRPLVRQCGRPGCRTGNSGVREDSARGARRRWASQAPRARPCLDPGPSGPAAAPPPGRSRAGDQKEGGGGQIGRAHV